MSRLSNTETSPPWPVHCAYALSLHLAHSMRPRAHLSERDTPGEIRYFGVLHEHINVVCCLTWANGERNPKAIIQHSLLKRDVPWSCDMNSASATLPPPTFGSTPSAVKLSFTCAGSSSSKNVSYGEVVTGEGPSCESGRACDDLSGFAAQESSSAKNRKARGRYLHVEGARLSTQPHHLHTIYQILQHHQQKTGCQ
jgi:hypothetical protein